MILYHTVEDRSNPDEIITDAPFVCKRENAWLGEGYYFWDTFIDNAHWWGESVYSGYVIVEFSCNFSDRCFDLLGNMEHLADFNKMVEALKREGLISKITTVAQVIAFLKSKTDLEKAFDAIRVYGHNSKSNKTIQAVFFNQIKNQYLDCMPAVQLCLFRRDSLGLSAGKIVFPNHYNPDYLV